MRGAWRKVLVYVVGAIMVGGAVWLGIRLAFPQQARQVTVQASSQSFLSRLFGKADTSAEAPSYEVDRQTSSVTVTRTDSIGQQHRYRMWRTEKGWVVEEMTDE